MKFTEFVSCIDKILYDSKTVMKIIGIDEQIYICLGIVLTFRFRINLKDLVGN